MKNLLLPMSGLGSRFKEAGYLLPKPLIDVNGKPMIQRVVENINIEARHIFLVLKEHYDNFNLHEVLPGICGNNPCEIVVVESLTEGAACTCLLAEEFINNGDGLLVANSDQIVNGWDPEIFFETMESEDADGGIVTFTAHDSKWSFAKVEEGTNIITEVAEKNPISDKATVGVYWFRTGESFVKGATQMISKNIRTNGEFYLCPTFNELIADGAKIVDYPVDGMHGVGTPSDLTAYLNHVADKS